MGIQVQWDAHQGQLLGGLPSLVYLVRPLPQHGSGHLCARLKDSLFRSPEKDRKGQFTPQKPITSSEAPSFGGLSIPKGSKVFMTAFGNEAMDVPKEQKEVLRRHEVGIIQGHLECIVEDLCMLHAENMNLCDKQ